MAYSFGVYGVVPGGICFPRLLIGKFFISALQELKNEGWKHAGRVAMKL